MSVRGRWLWVVTFGVAMGWMEAATVFYLRSMMDRIVPYQPNPLPKVASMGVMSWGAVELWREAATLVMLLAVGWLAGRTWRSRLACALIAFGVWDITYYLFLVPMSGWPRTVLDWDVLFLLPLPWWGPVLAPILIAALMIAGGTLVSGFDSPAHPLWPGRAAQTLSGLGVLVALFVFMAHPIHALWNGQPQDLTSAPQGFNWPLYAIGLTLMAAAVVDMARQVVLRRQRLSGAP